MSKNLIGIIIIVVIFAIIILEAVLYSKRIIKNGKKERVKIIKIEEKTNMSADSDDPGIMRYWFNLEIELNGEILKRQVAITDYTKGLKAGDYINVIVYKKDFLLEDELGDYKKWKN